MRTRPSLSVVPPAVCPLIKKNICHSFKILTPYKYASILLSLSNSTHLQSFHFKFSKFSSKSSVDLHILVESAGKYQHAFISLCSFYNCSCIVLTRFPTMRRCVSHFVAQTHFSGRKRASARCLNNGS